MPKPLRITLHIVQIIFLLFGLLCFALIAAELFAYDGNYTWAPDDEFMMTVSTTSVLLAIAFSPGLWSVVTNRPTAPEMTHHMGPAQTPQPPSHMAPPPGMPQASGPPQNPHGQYPHQPR
ncbi:hypothetical protein [Stackebrandtia soli]|uniref:hypothetical protein n=1 Tax=Stackebrandtia soli TaxID=1892856 RepID=UPI0039EC192C